MDEIKGSVIVGFIRTDKGIFQACDSAETAQRMIKSFNDGHSRRLAWRLKRYPFVYVADSVEDLYAAKARYEPPKREMEVELE
ncbi:MAG: hypothetical protein L7H18_02385 [Candidatus Nealsonbacteria bacterium DGGOD1a]|jgi:hypothetical protein|nr:MAG: hypothetical protein L7H18_02385 [Candidatus Nealsonbacteria bacterium DGGOD1a]